MFSFPQIDPNETGRVDRVPVPLNDYLSASFGQGEHDSAYHSIQRMVELGIDESDRNSPLLDVETANKRYGVGNLKFEKPIREVAAQTMNERKRAEMDRQFYLSNGSSIGRFAPGMAASILGGISNPLDFGLMFVPVVGEEAVAAKIAAAGGGAFRQALARGIVTREALALRGAPKLLAPVIQGSVGQAIFEIPVFASALQDQADYTLENSLTNIIGGGVLAGAIHQGLHLLGKMSRSTKEAMTNKAINDFLRDNQTRVEDFALLDEKVIRDAVKFDVVVARAEAIQAIGGDMTPIEAFVKAQLELDGHLGEVDEINLMQIAKDWIPLKEAQGKNMDIAKAILDRIQAGDRSVVNLQNLASQFDLEFNPMERSIPQVYHLSGPTDDVASLPKLSNKARREQAEVVREEQRARFEDLVEKEYQKRVAEFIERKRQEFDPHTGTTKDQVLEIRRAQDAGTMMTRQEVEELMHKEVFDEADVTKIEKDVSSLREDLSRGLTGEEQELAQKELAEALGQLDEPQEEAIRTAVDCIIKKVA